MPIVLDEPRLKSWASEIDPGALEQARKTSRLPIIAGHVALMPDAHFGIGATVGSVIPTSKAIIPAAVGVDIGCGMIAVETNLHSSQLPDSLDSYLHKLEEIIPAGVGQGHHDVSRVTDWWFRQNPHDYLDQSQTAKARNQFGTLGSGNHFFEVCLDEGDIVWIVIHSGSRGIGNQLATGHIKTARALAKVQHLALEDPDLAYFQENTPEFTAYMYDLDWAQRYALANRETMMDNALREFFAAVGKGQAIDRINCHHNYTARESHAGADVWVTRKGAIRAMRGDLGVIPGSMGTGSYIVEGKGVEASWDSCSHGAGRRMSRSAAKKAFTVDDLAERMKGKTWLADKAQSLLDEIPDSYKDIDQVMADQQDLVTIKHTLHQILNFKGA